MTIRGGALRIRNGSGSGETVSAIGNPPAELTSANLESIMSSHRIVRFLVIGTCTLFVVATSSTMYQFLLG